MQLRLLLSLPIIVSLVLLSLLVAQWNVKNTLQVEYTTLNEVGHPGTALHWYTAKEFNASPYHGEFMPVHRWKRVGAAADGLLHGVNSPYTFLYPVHAYVNQFKYFQKAHENQISKIFAFILRNGDPRRQFVVDVGANSGWYTALSGLFGYHTYSVDPQPMCSAQRFAMALHNNFTAHVHILENGISDVPTRFQTGRICNPKWDVTAREPGDWAVTVPLDRLFDVCRGEAVLVKVDTEGSEHSVLRSMRRALEQRRVQNIILEVSTVSWRTDMGTASRPLLELASTFGFEIILFELRRLAPRQYRYPEEFRARQVHIDAFTHQDIAYILNVSQLQHLLMYHNKTNSFGHIWFSRNVSYFDIPAEEREPTYEETHAEGRQRCRVLKLVGHWHACTTEELQQLEGERHGRDRRERSKLAAAPTHQFSGPNGTNVTQPAPI